MGVAWRLPLVVVALLAWLGGCGGDAANITGPPGFVAGYPRIERVGALTFVVAIRLDVPGAVDVVAASASEYPGCGECFEAMGVQCVDGCLGRCLEECLAAQNATNATAPPKPYFRRTIELPNAGRETRVLVRGAYNMQRPELSGTYGDFVVYPNTTYSVAVAPRNSSSYLNQPGDDEAAVVNVTTAAAVSSDASLARLGSTNSSALSPAFDNTSSPSTWSYETRVADDVDAVTVWAMPSAGAVHSVAVDGVAARPGPGSASVPPGAYSTTPRRVFYGRSEPIVVEVTAEDRETRARYELHVTRLRSTEARLGDLVLRSHEISPAFDPDVYLYTATVTHDVVSMRVIPTLVDTRAQAIRVNAVVQENKAASRDLPLRLGVTPISIEITAQDPAEANKKVYRIDVTRAYPSTDVQLGALEVSSVMTERTGRDMGLMLFRTVRSSHKLTPAFDDSPLESVQNVSIVADYNISVDNTVQRVTVKAAARDPHATLAVKAVSLDVEGNNNEVEVAVAAQPSPDKEMIPAPWNTPLYEYELDAAPGRTLVTLTVTAEDPRHSRTVSLTVFRHAPSANATLSDLVVHVAPGRAEPTLVPTFDPSTLDYTVDIDYHDEAVLVIPTVADDQYRFLRVNTVLQRSGDPSRAYFVKPGGMAVLTVSVTAEDGDTVMNYVVVVRRGSPSVEARLADLLVSTGNMTPAFSPDVYLYSLGPLRYDQNTVQVTPVAIDPDHERILVNGARQPSGSISREIEIEDGYGNGAEYTLGNGTVEVMVWAENGMTFKTYRILVTRQPAPISADDATLRELRISPSVTTRLIPSFSPLRFDYRLFVPNREPSVSVTPVSNDINAYRLSVNEDEVGSGGTFTTTMADLLAREDVMFDIEVRAKSCGPTYEPAECVRNHYKVEVLEYGPGAYDGLLHTLSGNMVDPGGAVRVMRPFPVPFKDPEGFLESLSELRLSEYDMGKKSSQTEGFCDNYLCADSVIDASLTALKIQVAGTLERLVGDSSIPTSALPNATVQYSPSFHNETRFYVADVSSPRTEYVRINATAASNMITGIRINGVSSDSGVFSADIKLDYGTTVVSIVVTAGRYEIQSTYTVHIYRPLNTNTFLADLSFYGYNLLKFQEPNLTSVPEPMDPCDVHNATLRQSLNITSHHMCGGSGSALVAGTTSLFQGFNTSALEDGAPAGALPGSASSTRRLIHPCDDAFYASHPVLKEACAEADIDDIIDCEPQADSVFQVAAFDYNWPDYLVNVESRTEYLVASLSVIDENAEMISIGKVRNCREAPRSSGCEGRDFADFGWDYGDYGIVSLRDRHESPPIDVDIGSTVGTVTVTAQDSITKGTYNFRAVKLSPVVNPEILSLGSYLDGLIGDSEDPNFEMEFTLRMAGFNPLWILDSVFRLNLEQHVRKYITYAAVVDDAVVSVKVYGSPRNQSACRLLDPGVAGGGVDVKVYAKFWKETDATHLLTWLDGQGWHNALGFTFDGYLLGFGPIYKVDGPSKRTIRATFIPTRRRYDVTLPTATRHLPLTVPPPHHVPPIEGFGVTVNGEEYTLGSTFSVEVPRCAIGPRHCDARHLTITAEACIFDECATYTVVATIPAVSIPADDASMRAVNITAGPVNATAGGRTAVEYSPSFFHDVRRFSARVDGALEYLHLSVAPNSPNYSGLFINGRPSLPYTEVLIPLSLLETELHGVLTVRVIAEDNFTISDTQIRVLVESPLGLMTDNANALDLLKGKYGFDGGVLPGGVDTAPPEWKESYPRLEPVWEGGPHLELAAQTMEPAVVYWALAVPWSRPPTSREVYDAVVRPNHTKTRLIEGSVSGFIADALNSSVPSTTESGFVAAGVMTSRYSMTREERTAVTCLNPDVGFDVYFVAEDKALDLSLNPAANRQAFPTSVRGVKPGSGPLGLLYPWVDSFSAPNGDLWDTITGGEVIARSLSFDGAVSSQSAKTDAAKGSLACPGAVSFEVTAVNASGVDGSSGDIVLEARREPAGEAAGDWTQLWNTTLLDLKTKSDASVDGWISVVSKKIAEGDHWTLRWRVEGSCCHSWALRNLTTRYITS